MGNIKWPNLARNMEMTSRTCIGIQADVRGKEEI